MSAAEEQAPVLVRMNQIRLDGGTQSRAELNEEAIVEYSYAYASFGGGKLPPVVVFNDGTAYWLADGFHRFEAKNRSGSGDSILAIVHQGTRRDAILYSVGANRTHGLRRTNADKRRAVETLLRDEQWRRWSDEKIAQACGVSREFVNRLRAELQPVIGSQVEREGRDGKVRRVPNEPRPKPEVETTKLTPTEVENATDTMARADAEAAPAPIPSPQQPSPAPAEAWWACPCCGTDYNRASAAALGWVKRKFCDKCEGQANVNDPDAEQVYPPPDEPAVEISKLTAHVIELEACIRSLLEDRDDDGFPSAEAVARARELLEKGGAR